MKKLVLVLLMAALAAGTMFAQDMSFGVGLKGDSSTYKITASGYAGAVTQKSSRYGANVFLDITYIEINADLLFGQDPMFEMVYETNNTDLVLGVVGKFPITLGDKIVLFPYAGIDYNINLAAKIGGIEVSGDDKDDYYNRLAFIFGVGADLHFSDSMFLRGELGFGFLLPNQGDKDLIDSLAEAGGARGKLEHTKVPFKVCIGWKL
jgi:opacity protein-like surface antigen